jgi:anionic cell wall polymer biosynthesis LytR-Cps2A-Psr (LCP) family protein
MEPIPKIVDDIGGVKIDVEIDMKTHVAHLSKGLQVLNGEQAYDYVHWRYSAGGDIDRIKRVQKFMKTLLKQQKDSGNVIQTARIVLKYGQNIQTDLSIKQIISLAYYISNVPDDNISSSYIPGNCQTMNGISYWVIDKTSTNTVLNEFFSP